MSATFIRPLTTRLKELLRDVRGACSLATGSYRYARTGQTPDKAYQSLIRLFCRTNGFSNEVLHAVLKRLRPPAPLPPAHGVLGDLDSSDVSHVGARLRRNGYYVFPRRLSGDVCDRLIELATTSPANLFPRAAGVPERAVYNRRAPLATTYRLDKQALADHESVKSLLADCSLLSVAQAYLGCQPVIDAVSMWWSTPADQSAESRSQAAQLFHFDMDRIKWIKFFFFLTDITPDTGPHCYVPKSHRFRGMPRELLRRGYARVSDEEIRAHYGPDAWVEITGQRGTIVAVDTRGYHKGKPLTSGERLVLEFELADCLFGGRSEHPHLDASDHPELSDLIARYPRVYSWFIHAARPARLPLSKAA